MSQVKQNSGLAHCVHHDSHWDLCPDYRSRVSDIRSYKPLKEIPLRLKLFQIVPSHLLSENLQKALVGWEKALADREKTWADLEKARKARVDREKAQGEWETALEQAEPELAKLHARLFPDCPWDGKTIFSKPKGGE